MAKRGRIKRLTPILPAKSVEMDARRRLAEIVLNSRIDAMQIIEAIQNGGMSQMDAADALEEMLRKWEAMDARPLATNWVAAVDGFAKKRLSDRVANAFGVSTAHILDDDTVREAVQLAALDTANKIKDVPRAYVQRVTEAAIQHYQGVPFPEGRSLVQQIAFENGETLNRAKRIALHQTRVINAAVNQSRQKSIGIEEYYWSSSHDERTVGNPSGKYPEGNKVHGNHWARDYRSKTTTENGRKVGGIAYRYDTPFEKGGALPGMAPNCRCVALPKMDMEKVLIGAKVFI